MINTVKAEFIKLLSVRSTYIILGLSTLIVVFFAFYIEGLRAAGAITDPNELASAVTNAVNAVTALAALVAVLLITHEYRYNTIMYTLTAAPNRGSVFIAKCLVVSAFAVLFSLFIALLAPALTYAGLQLKGVDLVPQQLQVWDLLWRSVFFGWGYSMLALLLGFIIRHQVGAIAALFLIPGIAEQLLGLFLKQNAAYTPFNLLNTVITGASPRPDIMAAEAALLYTIYVIIASLIAWLLFSLRDAN